MMDKAKFIIFLKEKLSKNKQKQLESRWKQRKVIEEHGKMPKPSQALESNDQEPRNTNFNELVEERTKEILELEKKNDYGQLMFVTTTEGLYDINKYRK